MTSFSNLGVVVAARMGSSRLPGKALLPLRGVPLIEFLLRRILLSQRVKTFIFATTTLPGDDLLAEKVKALGVPVFRGDSDDVVARYVMAARTYGLEWVIRVTGDCPFVDGPILDYFIDQAGDSEDIDLVTTKTAFPMGIDFEMYRAALLDQLHEGDQLSSSDREHLTKYFYDHPEAYRVRLVSSPFPGSSSLGSFTVDTPEDYTRAQILAQGFLGIDPSAHYLITGEKRHVAS